MWRGIKIYNVKNNYEWTNGPVAHWRLFVLSKLIVAFLKNETYGYGSRYSLKNI